MAVLTQEQRDINEIKESVKTIKDDHVSIRIHLDNIKRREDDSIISRQETNKKLDLLVNALLDNDFNGKNGHITRLLNVEKTVTKHDVYWNVFFTIVGSGAVIALIFKFLVK